MTGCCLRVSITSDDDDQVMKMMTIRIYSGSEDANHHHDEESGHDNQDGVMYKPGARFIDEATGSTLVCVTSIICTLWCNTIGLMPTTKSQPTCRYFKQNSL